MPLFASVLVPAVAAVAVAAAVAVPVLVHLLNRQRVRVVDFAAVRFLLAAQKRHHRRIDQWVLLAARVFALLLPLLGMLAVAPWAEDLWQRVRPGAAETLANAPRTHYVLVLDGSLSMTARPGNESRFEAQARLATDLVNRSNPGDGFTLLFLAGPPQVIVPGPSNDPEKVAAEIASLKPTHGSADLPAGLAAVADAVARSPRSYPRRQVLFFTDLQRSAWGPTLPQPNESPPEVWQRIITRAEVAVVDVAKGDLENLSVSDVTLADPLPLVDAPTVVTASVRNFGKSDRKQVRVELLVGRPAGPGQEPVLFPVEQRVIEAVPAGGRAAVTFTLDGASRFRGPGVHVLQVKLLDGDDLTADDSRSLAVEVRDGLPALLVNGRPASDPLRRASEYLSEALAPGGRIIPGNPARPRVVSPDEFADPTLSDLTGVDCVFLCDVPTLTPAQVSRLEAVLKRGGGVVIGLGPNAAANAALYNRLLSADGNGLLPGKLGAVVEAAGDDPGFRLAADEAAYRKPPLALFADDNARGGLTGVPFRKYVALDQTGDGRSRRILSFVPVNAAEGVKPAPAVVEMARHRGRVIVFTSTFNADWTDWPRLPSFLPFAHELLRFAATNPDRHTLTVGDGIEEFFPSNTIGVSAVVAGPTGNSDVTVVAGDETGLVRFPDTTLAGLYRVSLPGQKPQVFAVNVSDTAPGSGSESDLKQLEPAELKSISSSIQVVGDAADVKLVSGEGDLSVTTPRPWGPTIARWFVTAGVILFVAEAILAWRFGPGRTGRGPISAGDGGQKRPWIARSVAYVFLAIAIAALLAVLHAERTGHLLGFLPDAWRRGIEASVGVPGAGPGEGTRWRLESATAFAGGRTEQWLLTGLVGLSLLAVAVAYRTEARGSGNGRRLILPFALRAAALLFAVWVILPQLRLAFDREGWPDVAILIDTSGSMSTVDNISDPEIRAAADTLANLPGVTERNRLALAQAILVHPDRDLIARLLTERQVKVHVYSVADQVKLLAELDEVADAADGRSVVAPLVPDGPASRLGDAVQATLKTFRGGSLAAVILLTDGVTTAGDDLPTAGRAAARAGVPLYLVAVGDAKDPPDLGVGDLQAPDNVAKGDEIVFRGRLYSRGPVPIRPVTITLSEKQGDKLVKRAEQSVTPDKDGKPVPFDLRHVPTETGERTFVIEVPPLPGEPDTTNNRLERTVTVTDNRTIRVLFVEATPRYEFRFVKVLLERETEGGRAVRAVDLKVVLLDAGKNFDRNAREFPTRTELFEYDVVIWGDVDPAQLPKPQQMAADLADFVRIRGGGLLVLAGERATPHKLFGTPLADVLPVTPADGRAEPPRPVSETAPLSEAYRPRLTPTGSNNPLFKFGPDDASSARVWANLKPMFWHSAGYRRKAAAEVLAVHPEVGGGDGTNLPLVVQQFVGNGRVVFFGFDETWRWRFRQDEEQFNKFWRQAVRTLARNRVSRPEVRTDKQTPYRRDEPIAVTVTFPDDAPIPGADGVKLSVERKPLKDGKPDKPSKITLTQVGTSRTFQGMLARTPEGKYTFRLTDPEPAPGKERPSAEATVLPPAGEMDRVEVDRPALMRAAAESRGKVYSLADADKLIDELPDGARVPLNQPCPPVPVWNHAASFGLLMALLAAEWVVRRRERLL